jgi:C1A family cysteine protease
MLLRKLNYKFQKSDYRDHLFISHLDVTPQKQLNSKTIVSNTKTLPTSFSIRSLVSPILNQGSVGDCVSNAYALAISTMTKNKVNMSRLFHYAITRIIEDTPLSEDSGLYVRDGASSIRSYGVVSESTWPYITNNFSVFPPLAAFRTSNYFKNFSYTFVNQSLNSLKQCLITNKKPIVFGFNVYSSFMTQNVENTGLVPLPNTNSETLEGGHCIVIVGYDDTKNGGSFICANSWGTGWGDKGFCYIPYTYLTNPAFASDFCYLSFTY